MVNLYMIDTNAMGIPMVFQIQREKCFPMPTYDLSDPCRVKVTLFGRILDKNYTQLLYRNDNLDLHTVFMLDKIQKLTGGDSLKANIQLVYNNARLGAKIAKALCE